MLTNDIFDVENQIQSSSNEMIKHTTLRILKVVKGKKNVSTNRIINEELASH